MLAHLDVVASTFTDMSRPEPGVVYVEVTARHFVRLTEDSLGLHLTLSRYPDPGEDEDTAPAVDVGTGLCAQDAVRVVCSIISLL